MRPCKHVHGMHGHDLCSWQASATAHYGATKMPVRSAPVGSVRRSYAWLLHRSIGHILYLQCPCLIFYGKLPSELCHPLTSDHRSAGLHARVSPHTHCAPLVSDMSRPHSGGPHVLLGSAHRGRRPYVVRFIGTSSLLSCEYLWVCTIIVRHPLLTSPDL